MEQVLHVINGDATLSGFTQTGLDGDVIVWREVFSEGPLSADVTSASFWNARASWISDAFKVSTEGYHGDVVKQIGKLNDPYAEITIWFEFDLHCQVNMLGVMMLLLQRADLSAPAIYLVCPAEVPGVDDFRGMGQLNGEQLEDLYDGRCRLNEWEFTLAEQAWKLYTGNDAAALQQWVNSTPFWGNLPLLKPAMQAHISRLALNGNGLNSIEQKLLDIYQSGLTEATDIYRAFWRTDKIYGMGDAEINIYLERLKDRGLINL